MTAKMQQFLSIKRKAPLKRPAKERVNDFKEIYIKPEQDEIRAQASRCEQCSTPGCEFDCPLGNYILDWMRLTAKNQIIDAALVSQRTNPFPEICGRICPQERLCESDCVLHHVEEGATTVGTVEAWINDAALTENVFYQKKQKEKTGKKVAIIGAGPAGLACARDLSLMGHSVTVFEKQSHAGGLFMFGIPDFKLEKHIVLKRTEQLKALGVCFEFAKEFGKDISLESLKIYDAVFFAFGAYKEKSLRIPGNNSKHVHGALPFLIQTNKENLSSKDTGNDPLIKDKDVVVLGGGDTAMDTVRTALRKKAKSVTCLYRRDQQNMPGSQKEVINAIEEGATCAFLKDVIEINEKDGRAELTVQEMRLSEKDASGRQSVVPTKNLETMMADIVFVAFGFNVSPFQELIDLNLQDKKTGWLNTNSDGTTKLPHVFTGGDCFRGPSLAVHAIKDGIDAAKKINLFLKNK